MSVDTHRLLVRLVFPLGMIGGVALFWVALWVASGVLRLSGCGAVLGAAAALVVFSLYFVVVSGGGRLAVVLLQRRVPARCPVCREAAVGAKVWWRTMGEYRCRACGYVRPPPA
jgi:hypothetical protein